MEAEAKHVFRLKAAVSLAGRMLEVATAVAEVVVVELVTEETESKMILIEAEEAAAEQPLLHRNLNSRLWDLL